MKELIIQVDDQAFDRAKEYFEHKGESLEDAVVHFIEDAGQQELPKVDDLPASELLRILPRLNPPRELKAANEWEQHLLDKYGHL